MRTLFGLRPNPKTGWCPASASFVFRPWKTMHIRVPQPEVLMPQSGRGEANPNPYTVSPCKPWSLYISINPCKLHCKPYDPSSRSSLKSRESLSRCFERWVPRFLERRSRALASCGSRQTNSIAQYRGEGLLEGCRAQSFLVSLRNDGWPVGWPSHMFYCKHQALNLEITT